MIVQIFSWKLRRYGGIVAGMSFLVLSLVARASGVTTTMVHPQIIVDNSTGLFEVGTTNVLTGLSATCPDGPPATEANIVGPTWTWTIGAVQYSSSLSSAFGTPPSNDGSEWGFDPVAWLKTEQLSGDPSVLLFTLLQSAGYWQFPVSVSVNWHTQDGSHIWTGAASTVVANYPVPGVSNGAALAAPTQNNAALAATYTSTTQPGSPQETSWKFDITYTGPIFGQSNNDAGTAVTNGIEKVHAGWPIQLGTALSPSDLATKFTWKISGAGGNGSAAINGYVSNQTTGAPVVPGKPAETGQAYVVTLTPANDTKATFPDPSAPGILKYYYYTETKNLTASVQPQGVNIPAATTTFDVAAPTTKMAANFQFATRIAATAGPADYLYLEAAVQNNPLLTKQGILFTHPAVHSATFQGYSYFVQMNNINDTWTGIPPVGNFRVGGSGLDGSDPYGANQSVNGADAQGDSPYEPTDSNALLVSYSKLSIDETFTMWIMYHPKMSGSVDVPLDSCPWHFGGTATWNAAAHTWTLANPSPTAAGAVVPAPAATNSYPTWLGRNGVPPPPN